MTNFYTTCLFLILLIIEFCNYSSNCSNKCSTIPTFIVTYTKTEGEVIEHPLKRLLGRYPAASEVRFRLVLFPVSQSAPIVLHNDHRYRWLWPIVTAVINRCASHRENRITSFIATMADIKKK